MVDNPSLGFAQFLGSGSLDPLEPFQSMIEIMLRQSAWNEHFLAFLPSMSIVVTS
jgi:hypothetical protein